MDTTPTLVEFPLRCEWAAANTPGERIPSHGTDQLDQRYAYNFMRIDRDKEGWKFHRSPAWRYNLFGVALDDCHGWSEPFYVPFDGTVITAQDGWPERNSVWLLRDFAVVLKNALVFDPKRTGDLRPILENHLILKMTRKEVFAFFAHARTGSIQVREGDLVHIGQNLAKAGHSGNSTAPHLHFHLMDHSNILEANGLPCSFSEYESLRDGVWTKVVAGIPGKREFIRLAA